MKRNVLTRFVPSAFGAMTAIALTAVALANQSEQPSNSAEAASAKGDTPATAAQPKATSPRYRWNRNRMPFYPQELVNSGIEGVIGIRAQIDAAGNVTEAHVEFAEPSSARALESSALDSVKRSAYYPGTIHGTPVASSTLVPVRFRIDGHDDIPMPPLPADALDAVIIVHESPSENVARSDSPPKVIYVDWPRYSDDVASKSLQVTVRVHVDEHGDPTSPVVASSEPAKLDATIVDASIAAAMRGKYSAGTKGGRAAAGDLEYSFQFRSERASAATP